MNSGNDNVFRRFAVMVAVVATLLLFGASGAQAASTQVFSASGSLAAQEDEPSDEDTDEPSDEETEDPDEEDSEDSDDEDSDDEDSDTEEPTDEPTEQPTFTEPTDTTDDVTEMPTEDAGATSEEGPSPLGWILLAGGVACAAAAFLVYHRNRPL